jgi:hypothetical protein
MRKHYVALALFVAALGMATAGFAANAETAVLDQWKTSVQHTKFSQDYNSMKEVTQHLQHVVNCLEGQSGPGFEGGAGNPCQGQGAGMIVDAKKVNKPNYQAAVRWFETADATAKAGLRTKDPDAAKALGQATQIILEAVGGTLR